MQIIIIKGDIRDKRALENAAAANATLKANLDYVAMMAEVDLPNEGGEDDVSMVSEN